MNIKEMFRDDIQRVINGVVQVGDKEEATLYQQLTEYVVTRELRKHFIDFFNNYAQTGEEALDRIGVWISGFFGSGKSHFLKMLSHLLSNQTVKGTHPLDIFREKLSLDTQTMSDIERCCGGNTRTILFNIGTESPDNRTDGVLVRIFAKLFYNMLGYYGDDMAVVVFERELDQRGKLAEFRTECERRAETPWEECRKSVLFYEEAVIGALSNVMGLSEDFAAHRVLKAGFSNAELSVKKLVEDIRAYIDTQPADFRLLFMADEVGQYIGSDRKLLMELQSLVEELGSHCAGRVWIVCTGQEALDEVIKVRMDEFSRIQARFHTRLSLSSTSVEEVICKRLLTKTEAAKIKLAEVYQANTAVLKNLFAFKGALSDVRGFADEEQFISVYPFVPYQFRTLQKVFEEIRKHGNAGMHLAHGERSMLSGFQDSACKLIGMDELALAPFYCFYDTLQTFLGGDIRRVFDRAERAVEENAGLLADDIPLLKLLFLIRYIEDIPSTLDNLAILMTDSIDVEPIMLRERIKASLHRLFKENYISSMAGRYNFLTNEEQDIAREIRSTVVEPSSIIQSIGVEVFSNIYGKDRYRYKGSRDFSIVKWVDDIAIGSTSGDLRLCLLTQDADRENLYPIKLQADSQGCAIIYLKSGNYFEHIERALQIRKFAKQRNMREMHQSVQDIIAVRQKQAAELEENGRNELRRSLVEAECYIDGELVNVAAASSATTKIDGVLEELSKRLFRCYDEMQTHSTEDDVKKLICGKSTPWLMDEKGGELSLLPNHQAMERIRTFISGRGRTFQTTTFSDVKARFKSAPYGWTETDMAYAVALLIRIQKVDALSSGVTISSQDKQLCDMLLNNRQADKLILKPHESLPEKEMMLLRRMMQEYTHSASVPSGSEEEIFIYVKEQLRSSLESYEGVLKTYAERPWYPGKAPVQDGLNLLREVLSVSNEHKALLSTLLKNKEIMLEHQEALARSKHFFSNQSVSFNQCRDLVNVITGDYGCLDNSPEGLQALADMKAILGADNTGVFGRIQQLNRLKATLQNIHDGLLAQKKSEVVSVINDSLKELRSCASNDSRLTSLMTEVEEKFRSFGEDVQCANQLSQLTVMCERIYESRDFFIHRMQEAVTEAQPGDGSSSGTSSSARNSRTLRFHSIFLSATLSTERDVDCYLEELRSRLLNELRSADSVHIER